MALKQITHNSNEYKQMLDLRYKVLREPLGLSFKLEDLEKESSDILLGSFIDGKINACCVLTPLNDKELRLRQMAVSKDAQGKGLGATIMTFAENIALDKGYTKIIMHSRDTAIGFYEKFGYKVVGEPFEEVTIPHHKMEKTL